MGQFYYPAVQLALNEGPVPAVQLPAVCPAGTAFASAAASVCPNATTLYSTLQVAPEVTSTVLGAPGSTCSATCALQWNITGTPFCDTVALDAINDSTALSSLYAGLAPCKPQLLGACRLIGPPSINSNNFCSFPSVDLNVTCPPAVQATAALPHAADVCFTAAAPQSSPLCICSSHSDKQADNPFTASGSAAKASKDAVTSAAGRQAAASSLLPLLVACVVALLAPAVLSGRRASSLCTVAALLLVQGLVLAPSVRAHNCQSNAQAHFLHRGGYREPEACNRVPHGKLSTAVCSSACTCPPRFFVCLLHCDRGAIDASCHGCFHGLSLSRATGKPVRDRGLKAETKHHALTRGKKKSNSRFGRKREC